MGLFAKKSDQFNVIGKDIPWLMSLNKVFRVCDFDRLNTKMKNDRAVQSNPFKPYGHLIVDFHPFSKKAKLPIIHRDDFFLATTVYDEPRIMERMSEIELLVTYAPFELMRNGMSGSPHHVLHYALAPIGTFERYHALAEEDQRPVRLFGGFVYEGDVAVRKIVEEV